MPLRPDNVFARHVYLLEFLGVTITDQDDKRSLLTNLYFLSIQVCIGINTVCQLFSIFLPTPLPDKALSLVMFFVSLVSGLKLILVQLHSKKLFVLFRELNTPGASQDTAMLILVRKISRVYNGVLVTLLLGWVTFPWMTHTLTLPMPYWLPFEINSVSRFALVYSYVSFTFAVVAFTQDAVDTLFLLIAGQMCRRLDAVKNGLLTLGIEMPNLKGEWRRRNKDQDRLGLKVIRTANLSRDETLMQELIREHVEVIRLVRVFDTVLDDIFLGQVMQSTIVTTMSFFAASKLNDPAKDILKFLIILAATLIQFYIYCWLGEEITGHNDDLHRTVYFSYWYKTRERIMKAIVMMETYTKCHFKLEGGHLFEIGLETFLKVLNESFSYFMVLKAVIKD